MYQTINSAGQFRDAFRATDRADQFSYEALELLFEFLDSEPDYELDVISICCDYAESTPAEVIDAYGIEYDENEPTDHDAAIAYLESQTTVIGVTSQGSIVYGSSF